MRLRLDRCELREHCLRSDRPGWQRLETGNKLPLRYCVIRICLGLCLFVVKFCGLHGAAGDPDHRENLSDARYLPRDSPQDIHGHQN